MKKEFWKYVLMYTLALIGFCCFIILAGEETEETTFGEFCLWKLGALATMFLLLFIGKAAHRKGLLPKELDDENDIA